VVVGPKGPRPDLPATSVVRVVRDAQEGLGPLVGLSAGLAESRTELAVVVAGDMPHLSPAVLAAMLRAVEDEPSGRSEVEAVALRDAGSIRPLPLVVRAAAARKAARLLLQGGDRSLTSLLTALRARVLEEATWLPLDPERATMRDVDVPEDLNG
jgi:molybdopterin-guanine dinucleotide biosynthesis protein A